MLFVLSPAKTLDFETPVPAALRERAGEPPWLDRSAALVAALRRKSARQVGALMDISSALAELNVARYRDWAPGHADGEARPAALAFDGDVYDGLQARSLDLDDFAWAQRHLVILSGLYGALRPLDRIRPHRLEMGTALKTSPRSPSLYAFWGDTLAEHLNARLAQDATPVVVNLASQEYFRAVDRPALKARVVECVFEDWKNGRYKTISFFAKRARGAMARWAVRERVALPQALARFDADGYAHAPEASAPDRLVFRRRQEG
jgi:uncharacterized protein